MNKNLLIASLTGLLALAAPPARLGAQSSAPDAPYRVLTSAKVGGAGGFDYVYADADGRRLYVPRGNRVTVFDLDTLQPAGEIPGTSNVHGAVVDPKAHHGFCSSHPVVMWDTATLATIKTIDVQGGPDGILFDPFTEHVFILSHRAPNLTVIDARDGSIVGTLEIGGAPEQGASDGRGRLYFDVEDKDQIAVVDATTLQVTGHYDLGGKGSAPAGLALDAEHHILFACCRNPAVCVVLNADNGQILTTLPIGAGTDGATFNPRTLEAFSSQGDGTLTVIKENAPDSFAVEQTVSTRAGAKTCTLDAKTGRIDLITAQFGPPPPAAAPATPPPAGGAGARRPRRGPMVPDSFTILVVGR
jgi:DNA-binding beta-propeller fold protein YncE